MQTSGPPQNGEYMVAAYVVVAVVILGYSLLLWVRSRRLSN